MSDHNLPQLLRSYVDDELDPEQQADLARRLEDDPVLRARVRFERQLQERVGAAMGATVAPPELADRVRAALAEAETEAEAEAEIVIGRVDAHGASRRRSWLAGPQRANLFAVAAVLLIIAGVVLIGIFGPQIGTRGPDAAVVRAEQLLRETADFASQVHTLCMNEPKTLTESSPWTAIDESQLRLSSYIGQDVVIPDLTEFGYRFVGGGKCQVPGVETSGHVVYRREATADQPVAHVSMFMVPNQGQYGDCLPPCGMCDPLECKRGCCKRVDPLPANEVIYFIVCSDHRDVPRIKDHVARAVGAMPSVR